MSRPRSRMQASGAHSLCTFQRLGTVMKLQPASLSNGNNWDCIYDPHQVHSLQTSHGAGHQIASHTWSHPNLIKLDGNQSTSMYALFFFYQLMLIQYTRSLPRSIVRMKGVLLARSNSVASVALQKILGVVPSVIRPVSDIKDELRRNLSFP